MTSLLMSARRWIKLVSGLHGKFGSRLCTGTVVRARRKKCRHSRTYVGFFKCSFGGCGLQAVLPNFPISPLGSAYFPGLSACNLYLQTANGMNSNQRGTWEIVSTVAWDKNVLGLVEIAHIFIDKDGSGKLVFGALSGESMVRIVLILEGTSSAGVTMMREILLAAGDGSSSSPGIKPVAISIFIWVKSHL